MKKSFNIALGVASIAMIGAGVSTYAAYAYGDNSEGGERPSYTTEEIKAGKLGDKITFNSISDGVIGDEKNFVGARLNNGNKGKDNVWDGNEIVAEDGKEYIVRLYVHNNSPKGTNAIAKDVNVNFVIPTTSGTSLNIQGQIRSSNATPTTYWDDIVFKSQNGGQFHLEYAGGALLENNSVGKNGGVSLSDEIVTTGVKIGYDALDGNIPGCFQYASYITIKVKAVYDDKYTVAKQVRLVGEKDWHETVDAKVGDKVEFKITYTNTSNLGQENVIVKDTLPKGLKYISGTTRLTNSRIDNEAIEDGIIDKGLMIGKYKAGSTASVTFTAEVISDKSFDECNDKTVKNTGEVYVNGYVIKDGASVNIKADKTKDICKTPEPTPEPEEPKEPLPKTGPESVVMGAISAGSIVTAAGYYVSSRKKLNR